MNVEAQQGQGAVPRRRAPNRPTVLRRPNWSARTRRVADQAADGTGNRRDRRRDVPAVRTRARRSARLARCRRTRAAPPDRRSSSSPPTAASAASRRRPAPPTASSMSRPTCSSPRPRRREHVRRRGQVRPARRPLVHHRRPMRSRAHHDRVEQRLDDHRRPPSGASSRSTTCFRRHELRGRFADLRPRQPALYIGVMQFCSGGATYAGTSGFVVRKTSVIDCRHDCSDGVPQPDRYVGRRRSVRAGRRRQRRSGVGDRLFHRRRQRLARDADAAPRLEPRRDADDLGQHRDRRRCRPPHRSRCGTSVTSAATNGQLDGGDDRLTSASLVNGRLWTAHTIGVTDTGQASAAADAQRCAVVRDRDADDDAVRRPVRDALLEPARLAASTSATTGCRRSRPRRRGRTVIGFSAAGTRSSSTPASPSGSRPTPPARCGRRSSIRRQTTAYNPPGDPGRAARGRRWGGSSSTSLDRCDSSTVWTLQQYTDAADSYGLRSAAPSAPRRRRRSASRRRSSQRRRPRSTSRSPATSSGGTASSIPARASCAGIARVHSRRRSSTASRSPGRRGHREHVDGQRHARSEGNHDHQSRRPGGVERRRSSA